MSEEQLQEARRTLAHNPPPTKEACFYRRTFEQLFPGCARWLPHFWMPRWLEAADPSARTLPFYQPQGAAKPR